MVGGLSRIVAAIPSYDCYKMICKLLNVDAYHESNCPPSDPSARVRSWAYTGLCDGCADWNGSTSLDDLSAPAHPNKFGKGMVWPYTGDDD